MHGVEHGHVKFLNVNPAAELVRATSSVGFRASVEVVQSDIVTEPALGGLSEPRHLGEVHMSLYCQVKLHGLSEEFMERFV